MATKYFFVMMVCGYFLGYVAVGIGITNIWVLLGLGLSNGIFWSIMGRKK